MREIIKIIVVTMFLSEVGFKIARFDGYKPTESSKTTFVLVALINLILGVSVIIYL